MIKIGELIAPVVSAYSFPFYQWGDHKMNKALYAATAIILAVSLSACATKRFGRQMALTPTEKATLSCEQIALEIEKVDLFLMDVDKQRDDVDIRTVGAWLVDFGIGNAMEGGDAKKSGLERKQELMELRAERKCVATPSA